MPLFFLSLLSSLLALILAAITGLLLAKLGLHGIPGIIASAVTGLVIAALSIFTFCRRSSR